MAWKVKGLENLVNTMVWKDGGPRFIILINTMVWEVACSETL